MKQQFYLELFQESEFEHLRKYAPKIAGKIFNEGVYKENYSLEKALKALELCVGAHLLQKALIEFEKDVIALLISEKERRE